MYPFNIQMIMQIKRLGYLVIGLILCFPIMANARTALVIGNSDYETAPLTNPVNDATDIANKLRGLDFDVTILTNASRREMRRAVRDYSAALRETGGVGLFYYAGHGMQIKGVNYLVPTDAQMRDEFEIPDETVSANSVLRALEDAGNDLNIVVLDACRDNPFAKSYRSTAESGLARMDAPGGSIIAYATAPGDVAFDGTGRNGVYTKHLLDNMDKPGMPIEQMFKKVRIGVIGESAGQQTPWEESSLRADFYFSPAKVYEVVIPNDSENNEAPTSVPVTPEPEQIVIVPDTNGTLEEPGSTADPVVSSNQQQAELLLGKAARALDDYRLTTPKGDNALFYYREVLKVDPVNVQANDGLQMITMRYISLAEREIGYKNPNKAQTFINRGLSIQPENYQLQELQETTDQLKVEQASIAVEPEPEPESVLPAAKPIEPAEQEVLFSEQEPEPEPAKVAEVEQPEPKNKTMKDDIREDVDEFKKSISNLGKSIKTGLFGGLLKGKLSKSKNKKKNRAND